MAIKEAKPCIFISEEQLKAASMLTQAKPPEIRQKKEIDPELYQKMVKMPYFASTRFTGISL